MTNPIGKEARGEGCRNRLGVPTADGEHIDVRGCDLWAFDAEGKIVRKDSFWKIRETR